ncbi:rhomboid family intramembrane serine protease [Marinilabiliaceae bacterium D04]|uniref:Rhomboid family intramembrane serine protease n=2 Tax=Plebeiibacterium marinum TaxID=2992111 RepID=A0AAE3MC09_9BACT|nr:rhomboid family intramembrane serine protease [Plebeiobacterium marinum]
MSLEKRRLIHSVIFPLFFLFVIFCIKLIEELEHLRFTELGVKPLCAEGVLGIFTSPLVHGDWGHLYSNSVSLLVLGVALFYFYNKIAYKVFILIYLLSGLGTWLAARDLWHIGASGVIYGLAGFLALSGIIRRHLRLIAISFIVIFFYGSLVWGALPLKFNLPYSWEGHFWGGLVGLILAVVYRREGPQRPKSPFDFEDEEGEGDSEDGEVPYWMKTDVEP